MLKRRLCSNVAYFCNDVGKDEDGNGQNDRRKQHVAIVTEDVGEAADGVFDDGLSESDSETEGEIGVWSASGMNLEAYKRRMVMWKSKIRGKVQKFASTDAFRYYIWKYAIVHQFDYKLERNCKQRIVINCKGDECHFYICVRGHVKVDGMIVEDFRGKHKHSVGDQCKMREGRKRKLRAKLLARLIDGKIKLSVDYSIVEIIKNLQLELG